MTTPPAKGYLLQLTISALSGSTFAQQRDLLREVGYYYPTSKTWQTVVGALDMAGLRKLNLLFEAARLGASVDVEIIPAPDKWRGPMLSQIGEDLAAVLAKQADAGRPLGQVVV